MYLTQRTPTPPHQIRFERSVYCLFPRPTFSIVGDNILYQYGSSSHPSRVHGKYIYLNRKLLIFSKFDLPFFFQYGLKVIGRASSGFFRLLKKKLASGEERICLVFGHGFFFVLCRVCLRCQRKASPLFPRSASPSETPLYFYPTFFPSFQFNVIYCTMELIHIHSEPYLGKKCPNPGTTTLSTS